MWATRLRSCSPTWPPRLPAKSCTSIRASATWWLESLLLLQIRRVDGDVGAALEARDVGFVLGDAEHAGHARRVLLLVAGRFAFCHLADPQQEVARLLDRHAEVGR